MAKSFIFPAPQFCGTRDGDAVFRVGVAM